MLAWVAVARLWLVTIAVGLCAGSVAAEPVVEEAAVQLQLQPRLDRLQAEIRREAQGLGIAPGTLDRAFAGLAADPSIPELLAHQPEHVMAPWDYLGRIVSERRIADGRHMLAANRETLAAIEDRFGVDRHVVVAIWGIESNYGALPGTRSVVRSLATLAVADARRPAFWRKELVTALQILERGDIHIDAMTGSWAGAMGHTQFMPSSYMTFAVDHDGDGRRDIWRSVPDALASTASYLARSGWKGGEAWGAEVILPAGFDYSLAASDSARAVEDWQGLGLAMPLGQPWPKVLGPTTLLLPAGMHGPSFLVGANFAAILRYNNATAYALSVGHLADRLSGQSHIAALWPTHDRPLAKAERRELQQLLKGLGHPVGPIDGVIGDGTRDAIRAWQRSRGLVPDGWAGGQLLGVLRDGPRDDRE